MNADLHKLIAFAIIMLSILNITKAQNAGIGTINPHSSARLEIADSIRGLLIPRLTTTQRNAIQSPAHSLLIFNIDNFCIEVYDTLSKRWLAVSCPTACSPCDTCPLPKISVITGPDSVCPNDLTSYILTYQGGNTVVWNVPSSWTIIAQGDTAVFRAGSPGVIRASVCNECGCVSDSIIVTLGTLPARIDIIGPDSICFMDTLILSVIPSNLTNYQWNVPSGWTIISGTGSNTIKVIPSQPGVFVFSVSGCNGCGCSPVDKDTVVVKADPFLATSITGKSFICAVDTGIWKAPISGGFPAVWTWYYPSSWQVLNNSGDSIVIVPDTVDGWLRVSVCDTSGCKCTFDSIYVSIDSCGPFCISIGGSGNEGAYAIIRTTDGGYVIAGYTTSFGAGGQDIYVVKLDRGGNIQWTRTVGQTNWDEVGYDITQTYDNGYVIVGVATNISTGNSDGYVAKLGANGNLLWTKRVGGGGPDMFTGVIEDWNKNIVIGGATRSYGRGNWDMYLVKLDSAGNPIFTKTYGGGAGELGDGITLTPDGGYALLGVVNSCSAGAGDVYFIRTDSLGNIVATRSIGGGREDFGASIITMSDGKFAGVARTYSYGSGPVNAYVIRYNSNGNVLWKKVIGGTASEWGSGITESRDSNIIIVGRTSSFGQGDFDMYVVKLSRTDGSIIWTKTIGDVGTDVAYDVIEDPDGILVVVGRTNSFGNGSDDIYVVRFDPNTNSIRNCNSGCLFSSGGSAASAGITNSCGATSSGGNFYQGGSAGSGGTIVKSCP